MRRRDFIKLNSFISGGWVMAQLIPINGFSAEATDCFQPSPLIKLCSDGKIIVYVIKQEMGQGVQTSLPMIIAEELEADLKDILVEAMPFDSEKGGQYQTGGSTSVMRQWMPLRKAGAAAREMLIAAAAKEWNIGVENCVASKSKIINTTNNKEIAYKDLISRAAGLPIPKEPELKNYKDFKVIGKPGQKKNNIKEIITGKMKYGIDFKLPGMLYAAVVRCPVIGGKVKSFDAASVGSVDGVVKIFELKEMGEGVQNRSGVAIVANNRWSVFKAQQRLKVEWTVNEEAAKVNSANYATTQKERLLKNPDIIYNERGDVVKDQNRKDASWVSATYLLPFYAHATMEPVNCIAQFKDGKFELWGGFQNPGKAASAGSAFFGLKAKDVFINLMPMGGGFGRRLSVDYCCEAMQVAKNIDQPVQLLFSRADDIKFDVFRPASTHLLAAKLDANKTPIQWQHDHITSPVGDSILGNKGNPGWLSIEAGGGAYGDVYYDIKGFRSTVSRVAPPVELGWWRAVNFTYNNVVIESFIDELAKKAGKDGLTYRLGLLKNLQPVKIKDGSLYDPRRMEAVLKLAAEKIDWTKKRAAGRGLGIACCFYNHAKAYTAHAFEVSVDKTKKITIHRAIVATDVGTIIDPDGFANQVEGGFVWGLSAVMKSEITIEKGVVQQSSFFDFEVSRMPDVPKLEIHIIQSNEDPGGAGETSVPSVIPGIMNAVAAATGVRVRELPLKKSGYYFY
jgi:isoquinoline 1-oxidoreductase subunit beta